MGYNFREYDARQQYLLPPSIDEWVPEDSAARFIDSVVDQLHERKKLGAIFRKYRKDGWGRAAYHPVLMLKVLLYAYCKGITSSRKIASALQADVCFRFLSANQQPDFRTIADFRQKHLDAFQELFVNVLDLCKEAGLVSLGCLALDGRRVQGNTNKKKSRPKEAFEAEKAALEAIVGKVLEEAQEVDEREDAIYQDQRGDELPKDLRSAKDRMRRLGECLDILEERERQQEEKYQEQLKRREEKKKKGGKVGGKLLPPGERKMTRRGLANPTDPDSRVMKMAAGHWVQGYNGQAVADCSSQIVVAHGVTNQTNDVQQLEPMLNEVKRQNGEYPDQLVVDSGYYSESNLKHCEERTELFIPGIKKWKQPRDVEAPRGRIPKNASVHEKMMRKMATQKGKDTYQRRAPSIEGVFGQMWTRGLTRLSLRGMKKVASEWALWCLTHNLLKLYRSQRVGAT